MSLGEYFVKAFISLVLIMDPLGNLPLFLNFTSAYEPRERIRTAIWSSVSAATILTIFCIGGERVLSFFGISIPAFQITGGIIFFLYALQMLQILPSGMKTTTEEEQETMEKENIAIVPMGIPFIAGPGAITNVLLWRQLAEDSYHVIILVIAVIGASFVVYLSLRFSVIISRFLGYGGIRVISRLMGLLLAAMAVQFIAQGLQAILNLK
ncbi:MAG: MarC family protein [Syntrophobacterales bacterium]|nr:MarC family protein [Syntrophobacterales bacterium]